MDPPSKGSKSSSSVVDETTVCPNEIVLESEVEEIIESETPKSSSHHTKVPNNDPERAVDNEKENGENSPEQSSVKLPSLSVNYYTDVPSTSTDRKKKKKYRAESRGEDICRRVLETFYGVPFQPARPDFLVNPETMRNLELDMYNPDLKLALEYNGVQHYKYPNKFHRSREEHEAQKKRDRIKAEACEKAGINLIIVPYTVPYTDIPKFLEELIPEKKE